MIADFIDFAKKCKEWQVYGDYKHQAPKHLRLVYLIVIWSLGCGYYRENQPAFQQQSQLHTSCDRLFLQVVKVPLAKVKTSVVIDFPRTHIICKSDVPRRLYHDNGLQFNNNKFYKFYDKYGTECCPSTAYNPFVNSLAEAFNKTICKILNTVVSKHKRSWGNRLLEALLAYRTIVRGLTTSMPYYLVYGCEAIPPLEIQISSLRVAIASKHTDEKNSELRFRKVGNLDERWLIVCQSIELYLA